jgi:hypothetical protein
MSSKTYIKRSKHDKANPYFMLRRDTAQNRTLSFEARGMLAYLLSVTETSYDDLLQNCTMRELNAILDELVAAGYLDIVFKKSLGKE